MLRDFDVHCSRLVLHNDQFVNLNSVMQVYVNLFGPASVTLLSVAIYTKSKFTAFLNVHFNIDCFSSF